MPKKRLTIAVIGAGYWGKKLVSEYLSLSRSSGILRLKCVADNDKKRLAAVGHEFGLSRSMLQTDNSRVLRDSSLDAVHLAVPNHLHFKLGMEALESRKHVLLEKPMTLTASGALKLARTSKEQSLVLQVGHIFRFNNAVREARALLAGGLIGRPLHCHLHWEALFKHHENRDIIFDLAPHPVDVLNCLTKEWPTRVFTVGKSLSRQRTKGEEVAETFADFENNLFAHISLSWIYYGPKRRTISMTGDSGTIEVDALNQTLSSYKNGVLRRHPIEANNTIRSMIVHFANSILIGKSHEASAVIGAKTVSVLCAMKDSMKRKRFVNVV
jgi:UDP-N-acetylglucosamine 3-dehydrogenase